MLVSCDGYIPGTREFCLLVFFLGETLNGARYSKVGPWEGGEIS